MKRHRALAPGSIPNERVRLEQDSSAVRSYHPFVMPGLLQTPATARVVMGSVRHDPAEDLDRWVAYRMARQEVLSPAQPAKT